MGSQEWTHSPQGILKSLSEAQDSIIQISVHSPASHLFLPWPMLPSRTSYLCPAPANPTPLGFSSMLGSGQLPSKGCLCSTSVSSSARITSSEEKSRVKVLPEGLSRGHRCAPQAPLYCGFLLLISGAGNLDPLSLPTVTFPCRCDPGLSVAWDSHS